ncbi:hypothetical protein [Staphylococcus epidermidis]|uniref:hypothetical protein n=1 Tax=Staphylococcus epidermidis TaxID=1282 RepID=UPI00066DC4AB|nr:hypothetical protein [Staphylococcus epidermidis]MBF2182974.1 hypothetical protein [Staphylococcus epidermidis]MBF9283001.1 hypothetical protein [Staphylococcus epidermidis]MBF9292946.1 hypothetical protein [Staphylococcus epidermidis]MBF9306955.1 hypothetical protein [Staphylococcus epidermidis]MCG1914739.1 hypothetical protein [Staphylococcus epidermidis]
MNKLQLIKIALLTVLLVEEVRNARKEIKHNHCDVCGVKKLDFQLLHDTDLVICDECASHINDMRTTN